MGLPGLRREHRSFDGAAVCPSAFSALVGARCLFVRRRARLVLFFRGHMRGVLVLHVHPLLVILFGGSGAGGGFVEPLAFRERDFAE